MPRLAPITSLASRLLPCYSAGVSFVATCAQCREEVLEPDVIGDEEECALRDHLLAAHPNRLQPETLTLLLRHFVVTEPPPTEPPSVSALLRCSSTGDIRLPQGTPRESRTELGQDMRRG